jgi:hypothetical protein
MGLVLSGCNLCNLSVNIKLEKQIASQSTFYSKLHKSYALLFGGDK